MNETKFAKQPTLCWDCEKAIGKCNWSKYLKPVKGWKIIQTKKTAQYGYEYKSCIVLECPEFKRDAVGAGTKRYKEETTNESMSENT